MDAEAYGAAHRIAMPAIGLCVPQICVRTPSAAASEYLEAVVGFSASDAGVRIVACDACPSATDVQTCRESFLQKRFQGAGDGCVGTRWTLNSSLEGAAGEVTLCAPRVCDSFPHVLIDTFFPGPIDALAPQSFPRRRPCRCRRPRPRRPA